LEKAISNLKAASLMDVEGLHRADEGTLADIIRPSGYYNVRPPPQEPGRQLIAREFGGSLDRLFSLEDAELRARLLAVNGIGRETADSICCYPPTALFVVDAYTRRILSRHGVIQYDEDYEKSAPCSRMRARGGSTFTRTCIPTSCSWARTTAGPECRGAGAAP
jgi:endonuclease-3 related protein